MQLTTVDRMLRYIAGNNDAVASGYMVRRNLQQFIASTSANIENYLNREIEIKERTEYKSVGYRQSTYNLNAYPVISISSVFIDPTGQHDDENDTQLIEDSYTVNDYGDELVIDEIMYWTSDRGLRVTYTGGLAYTCARSEYSITGITGLSSISSGLYCVGNDSGAVSIVISATTNSMALNMLYGSYEEGEVATMYMDEPQTTVAGVSAVLETCTVKSLAESHPSIVSACENEVYYRYKHKGQYDNISTQKDGTSSRGDNPVGLKPETKTMLHSYKRYGVD